MTAVGRTRPVVAGVDFSTANAAVLSAAAWEAKHRGASLRLVHGFVPPSTKEALSGPAFDDNEMLAVAEEQLEEAAAKVRVDHPDLVITTKVVAGSGGMTLVDESLSAGLVVVGARGTGGFPGLPLGSVAAQASQHAFCPVLVVRAGEPPRPGTPESGRSSAQRVLVAVDGSPQSGQALGFAFDEAQARGGSLVAVHVWSVPSISARSVGTVWSQNRLNAGSQLKDAAEQVLGEVLAGWEDRYPQVEVERWTVHGDEPARRLLEVAEEVPVALIVAGARPRGTSADTVIGSVSQALVAHAHTSVAVIHPELV